MATMSQIFPFSVQPLVAIACLAVLVTGTSGCQKADPIVTYSVPTEVPEPLRLGKDRMLAAMVPQSDQTWFFKVTGPEQAVGLIAADFRKFVESIEFADGKPVWSELPD